MDMQNIKQFLKAYGRGEHIDIYELIPADESKNGKAAAYAMRYTSSSNINKANVDRRHDIYFTPNIINKDCRRTANNLKLYNALFIDMDAGRVNGKYRPLQEVASIKQQFNIDIQSFELQPTFIVETRNGYQLHWLLKDREAINSNQWDMAMSKLIKRFNSDSNASDNVRLMRLPFTLWQKKHEGLEPYEVTIKVANSVEHGINEMLDALKDVELRDPLGVTNKKVSVNTIPSIGHPITLPENENLEAIINRDFMYFRDRFGAAEMFFDNDYEAIGYILREIDMANYLGLNNRQKFSCLFHEDSNPSAFISAPEENQSGIYLYTCRTGSNHDSGKCDFTTGSILQVTERLMNASKQEARKFLYKCFNVTVEESDWKQEQRELLLDNIMALHRLDWEDSAPELLTATRSYLPLLEYIHNEANMHVKAMKQNDNGEVLFFFSQRRAASYFGYSSHSKISQRIAFLTFLKLVKKIPDADVPREWINIAMAYSKARDYEESIQFYSIPSYTEQHIRSVKERLSLWKKHNGTMKGISRDYFLLTFGGNIADEVYPKAVGRDVAVATMQFQVNFINKVSHLIDNKGWTTEKEVLGFLKGFSFIKEVKEKRVLDSALQELALKKIYLNKSIKELYDIGLPYGSRIIIPV
jgi:hypothetical protein